MLFASNFIGIACARSLHFQFCVWYFNTLPLLLAATDLPALLKVLLFISVELAWNPWASETSSVASSLLLTVAHAAVLVALIASSNAGETPKQAAKAAKAAQKHPRFSGKRE